MAEAGLVVAAFGVSYLGFAWLALRQGRHWQAVTGEQRGPRPSAARRTRLLRLGVAGLASALGCSWLAEGPSFGTLLWVLLSSGTSIAVTFTLTWRPRWLRRLS